MSQRITGCSGSIHQGSGYIHTELVRFGCRRGSDQLFRRLFDQS
jgi:hypothetical protein